MESAFDDGVMGLMDALGSAPSSSSSWMDDVEGLLLLSMIVGSGRSGVTGLDWLLL
jgi:hypothetical protein